MVDLAGTLVRRSTRESLLRSRPCTDSYLLRLAFIAMMFVVTGCYFPPPLETSEICRSDFHANDEIVGDWLATGGTVNFRGISVQGALPLKIGNHWEFTSNGSLLRKPGQDNEFRITAPGSFIECIGGRSHGVETQYRIEDNKLVLKTDHDERGESYILLYFERDPASRFKSRK